MTFGHVSMSVLLLLPVSLLQELLLLLLLLLLVRVLLLQELLLQVLLLQQLLLLLRVLQLLLLLHSVVVLLLLLHGLFLEVRHLELLLPLVILVRVPGGGRLRATQEVRRVVQFAVSAKEKEIWGVRTNKVNVINFFLSQLAKFCQTGEFYSFPAKF